MGNGGTDVNRTRGGSRTVRGLQALVVSSAAACLLLASTNVTRAEEIEHKFRLLFSLAGYNISDQAHSPSANIRTLLRSDGEVDTFIQDPRNDSAAFSNFGLEPQLGGVLGFAYAINRQWYVEASVGYRRGDVGNVEVQSMFQGAVVTVEQPLNFSIFNLNGGTIQQVPVQFTAGIRFRPKASFNPYVCGGIGYAFNSFTPSDELNDLSRTLDQSIGSFRQVTQAGGGFLPGEPPQSLSGITVDAPDAPEWHVGGGLEFTFASKWVVFMDARYTVYSGKFNMMVNGSNELGISVPSDQRFTSDPDALGPFGAVEITNGGLIDGGSLVPAPGFPGANCAVDQEQCQFTGPKDGIKDPGIYYVHAGRIRYDNVSLQIGFKFTF